MESVEKKTIEALRWIVEIFNKHSIPYRIGGGFAAKMYGSTRPLNDIDFGINEKYFPTILPEISKYTTYGPARYKDAKWDCELITLNYHNQEIDISGTETIKMSNKKRTEWISLDESSDTLDMNVGGIDIKVMNPVELMEYKKELDGNHQLIDIKAVENYLATNHQ
jgi:hypothetical protein